MNRRHFAAILLLCAAGLIGFRGVVVSADYPGAWVCIVEETGDRSADMSILIGSEVIAGYPGRKLNFRTYDPQSSDASGIVRIGKSKGLPALVISAAGGKLLYAAKIETVSVSAVDSNVRKVTGR